MKSPVSHAEIRSLAQATRHAEMDAIDKVLADSEASDRTHAFERYSAHYLCLPLLRPALFHHRSSLYQ